VRYLKANKKWIGGSKHQASSTSNYERSHHSQYIGVKACSELLEMVRENLIATNLLEGDLVN
jgi:hypothetical protein